MKKFLTRSWHEEEGQDSAEYALMFIMISVTVIAVLQIMGVTLQNSYTHVSSAVGNFSASGSAASSGSAGQPASGEGSSSGSASGSAGEPGSGSGSGSSGSQGNGQGNAGGQGASGGGNGGSGGRNGGGRDNSHQTEPGHLAGQRELGMPRAPSAIKY
jgi:Flp pilus assembly pilin Flp